MIYFKDILLEIEDDKTAKEIADEIGNRLDDILKQELEKVSKQQNEAILTATAFTLALPAFLNSIIKTTKLVSKKLLKKNLKTSDNPEVWYNILDKFTENIDSYIGKPFDFILKPIISDNIKRKKVVNVLKALAIATIAIIGNVDISKALKVGAYLKSILGAYWNDIIQFSNEKNLSDLITSAKKKLSVLLNKP